jgi:hypothetical protein
MAVVRIERERRVDGGDVGVLIFSYTYAGVISFIF